MQTTSWPRQHEWTARNIIVAGYIPPWSAVLDLGAGEEALGERLRAPTKYTPVDLHPAKADTLQVDLDARPLPDFGSYDYVVIQGVLEYLAQPEDLLVQVHRFAPRLIVTCYPGKHPAWRNHFTQEGFEQMLQRAQWGVVAASALKSQRVYSCEATRVS